MPLAEDKDFASGYSLGHDDGEIRRLQEQSLFLKPFTQRCLLEARIQPGMKVLDVGTGAGDVALLLARLVGPAGKVLGVDRNPTVLDVARRRVQNTGLSNVSFKAGDVHQLEADSNFDAVTGRLILFHLKDPAVVLRKLVSYLKPGGLVVFQDYNLGALASYPASDLLEQIKRWVIEAFLTAGADPFVGLKLGAIFQEAGLRRPQMICEASIGAELAWEGYDQIALVTRALLPVLVESGLASAEEVGIDTLAERLRQDVAGKGGVGRGPDVISAWTRLS